MPISLMSVAAAFLIVVSVSATSIRVPSAVDCGLPSDTMSFVVGDMGDGDEKQVTISAGSPPRVAIEPYANNEKWIVHSILDTQFCNMSIDFQVRGKPNPPPVKYLTATLNYISEAVVGSTKKIALVFTDPSGVLSGGDTTYPINTWLQVPASN
eukprot:m.64902 g.64902  ORF g.64902 m.64902 type:complete len:154 (-) comp23495_c0_seq1:2058-2519(-)